MKHIESCTGLYILDEKEFSEAFGKGHVGLFHLCTCKNYIRNCVHIWINRNLNKKVLLPLLRHIIALEIFISLQCYYTAMVNNNTGNTFEK